MDFELKEEHRMIRDTIRDFAEKEILKIADKNDEEERFPRETIKKLAELGFLGMEIPEEYGGAGTDSISYAIAIEELSRVCPAHGVIVSVNNSLVCYGLYKFGNEEQKRKFLTPLARGEKLGAFALTEPHAGSDASNLLTTARKEGNEYIINGKKVWVTNGPEADYILVFAVTDKEKKHRGITCFIADCSLPGLIKSPPEKKLGIRSAHSCEITFENYRIPLENRLGEEGEGFKIAMSILDAGRIGIAAQAVGIAQAALEYSIKFGRERVAFGVPIIEHQAIAFYIAEMETRIRASRLLTYYAAWKKQKGEKFTKEASMAKYFASETAMWATTKAIQIHGSMGYSREHPVQRFFRDAKVTEIYEGTNEIQKIVIARETLKEYEKIL
ncbi:MAG: acyl-CoA dehydrogenase [candidate division WOR-3 bacterium]